MLRIRFPLGCVCVSALLAILAASYPAAAQAVDLAGRVEALFRQRCAECHDSALGSPKGGFGGVEQLPALAANRKYIEPGSPSQSLLYQYISGVQSPRMPKDHDPLTDPELALVRTWIESGAAPPRARGTERSIMSEEDLLGLVHADAAGMKSEDRKHKRYFSLTSIWNESAPVGTGAIARAEFDAEVRTRTETCRVALAKLLNSLSWAAEIAVPVQIDADGVVLRIDLRDFKGGFGGEPWGEAEWRMVCERYPYGRRLGLKKERDLTEWLGTELPVVRADWFVFAASRPPLYHELLGLPGGDGKPGADAELERVLEVVDDTDFHINIGGVARAGLLDGRSGVSLHNRLVERREKTLVLIDGPDGDAIDRFQRERASSYYWRSYDFEDSIDAANLASHPLGPSSPGLPTEQRDYAFAHKGGEIIFALPNGLQGYMVVDAAGRRLDDAPASVVFDRESSAGVWGRMTNGISCIACHAGGIIPVRDGVRSAASAVLPRAPSEVLERLYPTEAEMTRLQVADRERFRGAMRRIDPSYSCDTAACEPVRAISRRFAENPSFARAAAEFGVAPDQFTSAFGGPMKLVRARLESGAVSRAEFSRVFRDIVADNEREFGEMSTCEPTKVGSAPTPEVLISEPSDPATPTATRATRVLPGWDAEVLADDPDPAVVTDGDGRARILKTGLPWKVRDRTTGIVMVLCPPGEFMMGSPESESGRDTDESQHRRTIRAAFYLATMEVTQEQWLRVMQENPSVVNGGSNPVEQVSWNDCQRFCALTGFRLPSEAEWEYACRAGTTGAYSGDLSSMAWFAMNSGRSAHPVGTKQGNPWGLFDMHGNVWEWCEDIYGPYPSQGGTEDAATLGTRRVLRGGAWNYLWFGIRSSYRNCCDPGDASRGRFGFRVARTAE